MISGLRNANMIDHKQIIMRKPALMILILGMCASLVQAQKLRTYTATEEDSIACITALSLYIEFFKQDNYTDAINGWRKAAQICPKATESLWINGTKIYGEMIEKESDDAKKEKLIDTLEWVYDMRIQYFDNEGYVLGRKGADMLKYRGSKPKAAYDALKKSMDLQGLEMEPGALIYYYKSIYDLYKNKEVDRSLLFEAYGPCSDVIDHNKSGQLAAAYEQAATNIDKMFSTVAECPDLIEIYTPTFNATPKDEKLLRQILKLFEKRDCTDSDLYQNAAVNLYGIEPSAEAAYAIANGFAKKEKYNEAIKYYRDAADLSTDNEFTIKALNKAGNTALLLRQHSTAKSIALQILKLSPGNGDAYIIIGDAYMGGRGDCNGINDCEDRAAYWAAYDKYAQAKSVDGSVATTADKRMAAAKEQFPKKEDCFFYSKTEGQSYTVGCWIGESTTVRTRD